MSLQEVSRSQSRISFSTMSKTAEMSTKAKVEYMNIEYIAEYIHKEAERGELF